MPLPTEHEHPLVRQLIPGFYVVQWLKGLMQLDLTAVPVKDTAHSMKGKSTLLNLDIRRLHQRLDPLPREQVQLPNILQVLAVVVNASIYYQRFVDYYCGVVSPGLDDVASAAVAEG